MGVIVGLTKKHPREALTARSVASLSKPGRHADGRGLYLLVAPSGSKSWLLRVKVRNGRREDLSLGSAADLSLENAREAARRWRTEARAGRSPVALRREHRAAERAAKEAPDFETAARSFHALHAASFRNTKHRAQWLSSLTPAFHTFGSKRLDDVQTADVVNALEARWLERPETSRRVLQRLRLIFDWARAKGYRRADNPTRNIERLFPKRGPASKRHHAALKYEMLPAFLRDLRSTAASASATMAFEFLILTGTRTSETLRARWAEIDVAERTWTIPADRMKSGIAHRVPLSARCLEILGDAKKLSEGGALVFPGRRRSAPMSNMVFLMILRRMKRRDITAHGFRSTFRDWIEERTHTPHAVAEAALAHVVRNKVEAAYRRSDLFEKRRTLMESWSRFATETSQRVVRIRA